MVGDIRDEDAGYAAPCRIASREFGGIDICVNNASAIALMGTLDLPMKRYDLMQDINARAGRSWSRRRACLRCARLTNPHVLTLSPPLDVQPKWFGSHPAYTLSKFGMSMLTMGMAEEFRGDGIAFNCLWPRTLIATAAVQNVVGGDVAMRGSRRAGDRRRRGAWPSCGGPSRSCTGQFFIDEDVLRVRGRRRLRPVPLRRGRIRGRPDPRPLHRDVTLPAQSWRERVLFRYADPAAPWAHVRTLAPRSTRAAPENAQSSRCARWRSGSRAGHACAVARSASPSSRLTIWRWTSAAYLYPRAARCLRGRAPGPQRGI